MAEDPRGGGAGGGGGPDDGVAVFPLPNFVLFPGTGAGLHVFEPRYKQMTSDVLAGDRRIVLVGLRPGFEADYHGSPPVHHVGSLCRIAGERKLPGGRYNFVAVCVARIRLIRFHQVEPYRRATIMLLPDRAADDAELEAAMAGLRAVVRALVLEDREGAESLLEALRASPDAGLQTFRLSALLATDPLIRQRLLETTSAEQRAHLLTDLAATALLARRTATGPDVPPD